MSGTTSNPSDDAPDKTPGDAEPPAEPSPDGIIRPPYPGVVAPTPEAPQGDQPSPDGIIRPPYPG